MTQNQSRPTSEQPINQKSRPHRESRDGTPVKAQGTTLAQGQSSTISALAQAQSVPQDAKKLPTCLTPHQLGRLSLADLVEEEQRAVARHTYTMRRLLMSEARAAQDYCDNVTFSRQRKQYKVQDVKITEVGKGKLRFSFTATPALIALLEREGAFFEQSTEESLCLGILQFIADAEKRLAFLPTI